MSTESRVGTGVAAASYWSFRHRPIAASATRRSRPEFTLLWEGSGTTRRRIQSSIRLAVVARWRIGRLQRLHLPFLNACPLGRVPDRTSPPHKLRGVAHVGDKARGHHHFDVAGHGTIHASDTAIFLVISLHTTTREGRLCSRQFHLARLMPHKSEQRGMLDCIAVRRSFLKPYLPTRLEKGCPTGAPSKCLCMLHRLLR